MNNKVIRLIPSIILYLVAGLVAAYAIWAYTHSAEIVAQAKEFGQLSASGNEYEIASFYMSTSGHYAIYALLLAAAGYITQKMQPALRLPHSSVKLSKNTTADNELDEWFEEMEAADNKEIDD
ncbi:MAG: hypothetical protein LBD23_06465 [Oscillospiraceae bacterium]|nr:hypothetical protein [Oscillospiraceae bacterium]